ncbi:MAG: hypothetical protein EA355_06775 [Rhodobacteraceae bacterium]|nr:MAG: hypothetical protein EA355_06775 [Paracoccaceae bacterium]
MEAGAGRRDATARWSGAPGQPARRARLTLFRGFVCAVDGQALALGGPRAQAVIAMLALGPTEGVARAEAARTIWSEVTPERARASLRQALRALRASLDVAGLSGLLDAGPSLRLAAHGYETDVGDVLRAAHVGVPHPTLLGEADPFAALFGLDGAVGDAFAAWVGATADELRRVVRRALAQPRTEPHAERDSAHACALLDPADEGAARRAMAAHAALGETHRALAVYDRLWRTLDARIGAEPGEATQRLLEQVRRGANANPRAGPSGASPEIAAAAPVLWTPPFTSDGAPGAAAAAAVLRLDFSAAAARLRGWRVRLGDAVGESGFRAWGAVRAGSTGLVLRVALESSPSGDLVWSMETAATVAGAARAARAAHAACAQEGVEPGTAVEPGALSRLTARSAMREAAVVQAPALGLLTAALAGAPPAAHAVEAALAAAHGAVDGAPLAAPARRALGWAQLFARQFADAAEAFALAAELDPTDPCALRCCALGLALAGQPDAARTALADATAIEPDGGDPIGALAMAILGEPAPTRDDSPLLLRAWAAPDTLTDAPPHEQHPPAVHARRLARALPMADEARAAAIEAAIEQALRGGVQAR